METSVIAIIAGLVIMIALSVACYMSGFFDSTAPPESNASCGVVTSPPFVPRYRRNDFSCREPVNVPGSIMRGTLQKCESACDNILACVGFDRRADVKDDQDAFCSLQMSHCSEKDGDRRLSTDQDGNKWKRHIKP